MSYGLYDGDLILFPKVPFYNLELMKLSSYYKSKRQIVTLSKTFEPRRYSNFIIRQDFFGQQTYPSHHDNVVYGGRAFEGNKYIPLPIEAESCKPDTDLYNKIKLKSNLTLAERNQAQVMHNAAHLRLSLDGKTVWKDFKKQLLPINYQSGYIFHDYNLNDIENAAEIVTDLMEEYSSHPRYRRLGVKFPIQVDTEEDFFKWLRFSHMVTYYTLQFNGFINLNYIDKIKSLEPSVPKLLQTSINVTANTTYEKFITQDIVQILPYIVNLRTQRIQFPLIYDEHFFVDKRWLPFMNLISQYSRYITWKINNKDYLKRQMPYETFYSYIRRRVSNPHQDNYLPKEDMQRIFQFVREQNTELFIQLYECC